MGYNCEINRLKIKNTSEEDKEISLFSFVEFCLWDAYDDANNFQRNFNIGEVEVKGSTIYHKTEYRERRNHFSYYSVNTEIDGFDTDRNSFIGMYNGFEEPDAAAKGISKNSIARGWAPIASHRIKIKLRKGEEKTLVFILGYTENKNDEKWTEKGIINKKKAEEVINYFNSEDNVTKAFENLKEYWSRLLESFSIETKDEKLKRMVNTWNPYQCMVTFNLSRSASYFESGVGRGMGFRDSNQDILGFVHLIPDKARERILDIAATQFEDGGCYHQYQPLTKKGNNSSGTNFNDDPLWLILAVVSYIKETGETGILNEMVPFDSNENNKASLADHLRVSFDHVINNLGPHKLPLIGRADWNDCLNLNCFSTEPGESFQTLRQRGRKDSRVSTYCRYVCVYRKRIHKVMQTCWKR